MEVIPKHSIMTEWKKKASTDRSDITVKDLIWRLFDTCVLTSGLNRLADSPCVLTTAE